MSLSSLTSRTARPALILGVSAAILSLGLSACSVSTSGTRKPSNGSRTPAASATAEAIKRPRAGDCYQFSTTNDDDDLTIVSCNQPHDAETFHAFEFHGDRFPTDDELDQASDEICGLMFEYYVGKPVADSALDYSWTGPAENLWTQGDRIVECYAFAKDDSKLTQSVRNSNM